MQPASGEVVGSGGLLDGGELLSISLDLSRFYRDLARCKSRNGA